MDASEIRPGGSGWDAFATGQAKSAIVIWLLSGWIYNIAAGHFLSLSSVLLFVPGIFLASFAAIPGALVNAKKVRHLTEMKQGLRRSNPLELLGWTAWYVVGAVYMPILAVLFVRLVNSWYE